MPAVRSIKRGPKHPWYDDSRAPIILMRAPASVTDAELAHGLACLMLWLDEVDALFGFIADFSQTKYPPAKQRKMFAEAEQKYRHIDYAFNAGQAFVVPSTIVRGALTAVFWLSPPVYPYVLVDDLPSAWSWAGAQFERHAALYPRGRGREGSETG